MKKASMLMLTLGSLSFIVGSTNYDKTPNKVLDSRYIVSLNVPTDNKEAVEASQEAFKKQLRNELGYAFKINKSYKKIDNALLISINEKDKKIVENLPLVSDVTKDEIYFFAESNISKDERMYAEVTYEDEDKKDEITDKSDPTKNYSAETMNVPEKSKTNGGEGTLIAVLDSGFALNHNAFKPLDSNLELRYPTNESVYDVVSKDKDFHAKYEQGNPQTEYFDSGEEVTNTFYNNKIPFQYDYGGSLYFKINKETNEQEYYHKTSGTSLIDEYEKVSYQDYINDIHFPDTCSYSAYNEHGTHVAGIIGSNDRTSFLDPKKYPAGTGNFEGIAPNSQLALMKVFTDYIPIEVDASNKENPQIPHTGASDSCILDALEDCLTLKVDAINMSLGQDMNDFDTKSKSFKAFKKLKENGTLVNVSAGNNGKELYTLLGPYADHLTGSVENGTLGSYGNSTDVMTIGSGQLTNQYFKNAVKIGNKALSYDDQILKEKNEKFVDHPLSEIAKAYENADPKGQVPYYMVPGLGKKEDYPDGIKDYIASMFYEDPVIAVVMRGETTFIDKIIQAKDHGFKAVIIINNDPGATDFNMRMDLTQLENIEIPVAMALFKDKPIFEEGIANATSPTAKKNDIIFGNLEIIEKDVVANPKRGQVSEFSTDGATFDLRLKPEIIAPGSVVKGPVPGKVDYSNDYKFKQSPDSYDYLSGTSMSGPNYTGAVAVALSNHSKTKDKERDDYGQTIPMRLMSTASIKSSTVGDINFDNKEEMEKGMETAYSVRRQGAGMVDLLKALETKVYLEGTANYQTEGSSKGRAKIELFNNKDIAQGDVKLKFTVHNTGEAQVTYKPTIYLYRPDTRIFKETPSKDKDGNPVWDFKEFNDANVEMQTITQKLIKSVACEEVVVAPNEDKFVELRTTLTDAEKKVLNEKFENGVHLEGYVVLENVNSTPETKASYPELNIPFLGFYGDYFAQEPVEKFDFERKPGEILGSDLLQQLNNKMGLNTGDFSSMIRGIRLADMNDRKFGDNLNSIWTNKTSLKNPAISKDLNYNPETNAIYAGSPDTTDLLFFQLFVNRSVKETKIELLDKNGRDYAFDVFGINKPRFYDPLMGADDFGLSKSMASASWLGTIQAHRAHAFLPLIDSKTGKVLPDGEYTIKMGFTYQASVNKDLTPTIKTFEKEVKLIIDSTAPEVIKKEFVKVDGTDYLRVYILEKHLKRVSFNGGFIGDGKFTPVEGKKDTYYTQVPLSEIRNLNKDAHVYIQLEDIAYSETHLTFNLHDTFDGKVTISSMKLNPGTTLVATQNDKFNDKLLRTYKLTIKDDVGQEIKLSNHNKVTVYVNVNDFEFEDPSELKVYKIDKTGYRLPIKNFDYIEGTNEIKFEIRDTGFAIEGKSKKQKGLSTGAIIGISVGSVAGGAAIGVGIYFLVKLLTKKPL